MLTKITRQHHTDRQRLRCVPGLHEFVLQLLKFSFEPLMGLHQVTRYLWHATTSDTSTLKHHYHHHMKSCIFSNFPLSLQHVTRCLWHTSQHLHTNISNTFKHHHHFMNWKASKISALTRSPTRMKVWELLSMVWVLTKRHVHKGKEDVYFEWCWSCRSWRKESCINVLISTYM